MARVFAAVKAARVPSGFFISCEMTDHRGSVAIDCRRRAPGSVAFMLQAADVGFEEVRGASFEDEHRAPSL